MQLRIFASGKPPISMYNGLMTLLDNDRKQGYLIVYSYDEHNVIIIVITNILTMSVCDSLPIILVEFSFSEDVLSVD